MKGNCKTLDGSDAGEPRRPGDGQRPLRSLDFVKIGSFCSTRNTCQEDERTGTDRKKYSQSVFLILLLSLELRSKLESFKSWEFSGQCHLHYKRPACSGSVPGGARTATAVKK